MKRVLLTGFVALAPLTATAALRPFINCLPAQNEPVCLNAKPSLLDSDLDCQLCTAGNAQSTSADKGKELASFCDALRMMSVLSPCDEMQSDIAKTDRTTM